MCLLAYIFPVVFMAMWNINLNFMTENSDLGKILSFLEIRIRNYGVRREGC
jgi:hypothetical protein